MAVGFNIPNRATAYVRHLPPAFMPFREDLSRTLDHATLAFNLFTHVRDLNSSEVVDDNRKGGHKS